MHIAYVCADPGIPVFGTKGASVHVQEVLGVLLAAGHTVDLFCRRTGGDPTGTLADAATAGRLTVHRLDRITDSDVAARERGLVRGDGEMRVALAAAARARPFDAVYERYSLWSRAGTRYAGEHGLPSVVEVNAPLPLEQARHRGLVHTAEADAVARDVLSAATAVVCVSEPVAAWARRQAPWARVRVEPNGVNTDRIRTAYIEGTVPPQQAKPFTVGFVGTLKPWHGTETLLDAVALLVRDVPDAQLLLVGDGPQAEPLRRRADDLGIAAATTFAGAVRPAEVPAWLAAMDAATAPYPAPETSGEGAGEAYFSPLKVLEYMAAGLPVVASAVGQLPDLVDDGRTGILVPGSDPAALAATLADLAGDPARRRRLGTAARREVARSRTWTHVVDRSLAAAGLHLRPTEVAV
ncbi:glycosyltransferase family 4 protein [Georgenia halophila]|uniref:Glycosyltransferase family 4 protein n=1 Tax=Georgenia halophila TaxID=620889 RepID=A0ABP8LNK9_9MICO